MDPVEFINERHRMCRSIKCSRCKLSSQNNNLKSDCFVFILRSPAEALEIVEKWSKEHPVKTRQNEFLKHYPNADIDKRTGALALCPARVFGGQCVDYGGAKIVCVDCRKRFWLEPVEE